MITAFVLTAFFGMGFVSAQKAYVPEEGSVEKQKKKKSSKLTRVDPNLPMVLILGDSISMGYTPVVKEGLKGKANVIHNPGNSQGTTHTLKQIDSWLKLQKWDVIHFNLGLHDLKRVKTAGTSDNSNDPNDPYQADLATYEKNLSAIVAKLKKSGASLVFATTTPFPAGVKPHRDPRDAVRYNDVAKKIMKANGIPVNDLYTLVKPRLKELQKPVNVHFSKQGSTVMGDEVTKYIESQLPNNKQK